MNKLIFIIGKYFLISMLAYFIYKTFLVSVFHYNLNPFHFYAIYTLLSLDKFRIVYDDNEQINYTYLSFITIVHYFVIFFISLFVGIIHYKIY